MEKASELSDNEYNKEQFAEIFKIVPISLDNKQYNFGRLKNKKIVLVDYADSRYFCSGCSDIIKKCNLNNHI